MNLEKRIVELEKQCIALGKVVTEAKEQPIRINREKFIESIAANRPAYLEGVDMRQGSIMYDLLSLILYAAEQGLEISKINPTYEIEKRMDDLNEELKNRPTMDEIREKLIPEQSFKFED